MQVFADHSGWDVWEIYSCTNLMYSRSLGLAVRGGIADAILRSISLLTRRRISLPGNGVHKIGKLEVVGIFALDLNGNVWEEKYIVTL